MDGQNIEDVDTLLLRLQRERAALIDEAMKKDGELALMGKSNITKTDAERRRRTVAEKKEIERKAFNIKQQIRCVEEGRMSAAQQVKAELKELHEEVEECVEQEIADAVADAPVTDHAVIRWLERKHGLDIQAMRRDIYEEVMGKGGKVYKNGWFYKVVKDGIVYVVDSRNKTVITCYVQTNTMNNKWKEVGNGQAQI